MLDRLISFKQQITSHKYYPYAATVLRAGIIYLVYSMLLAPVMHFVKFFYRANAAEFFPDFVGNAVELLFALLVLNTVLLSFALFHRYERNAYLRLERDSAAFDSKQASRLVLRTPTFWMEIGLFTLCFFAYPNWAGYEAPLLWIPGALGLPMLLQKAIVTALFLTATLPLSLFARIDARKFWLELPSRLSKSKLWKSMESKQKFTYSYWRLALRLLGYTALYCLGGYLASIVIPVLYSILRIFGMFTMEASVVTVAILLILLVCILTLRKRMQFIRALKSTCKQNGYRLYEIKHPYLSVFRDGKRYTFVLEANGNTYFCKILACVRRSNKMFLSDSGTCTRSFSFHIPTPQMARSGGFVQVADRGTGDDRELFCIHSTINYTFSCPEYGKKILILNPVPRRIFRVLQGHTSELDNGDCVGEYTVYTGGAFLRSLILDTTKRDP